MAKSTTVAAVALALAAPFAAPSQVASQERVVVEERTAPPRQRLPARIAPYRHADEELDSAMRFVAETVTEEPRRGSASFQVWIPEACTLRFDQLNAGGWRVPVHLVNLTHVAPDRFRYRDSMMCLETTSLENRIVYYELPVDQDGSYPLARNVPTSRRLAKDRFCFRVSGGYSYRVWRALAAAIESCGGRTEW